MTRIQSRLAAALLLAIGLGAASAAQAGGNVYFSVYGDPAVRYDQPVYVQPEPVYVQPQPVYDIPQWQDGYAYQPVPQYVQPAPVYVRPAPAYVYDYGQRDWYAQRARERAEWRRQHWGHRSDWDQGQDHDDDRRGHGHRHGHGHGHGSDRD